MRDPGSLSHHGRAKQSVGPICDEHNGSRYHSPLTLPLFNPIYTILFVKAYRHALLVVISRIFPIKRTGGAEPLSTTAGFDLSVAPSLF